MKNIYKKKSIMIVAGGTGGHISPGAAVAGALTEKGVRTVFLTLEKNRNNYDLSGRDFPVFSYDAPSFSVNVSKLVFFIPKFLIAVYKAAVLMHKEGITAVAAMGGYPCLPALSAALIFRKKIVLFEQNVQPGKVTRWFLPYAEHVFWAFPPDLKGFKEDKKNHVTGNPIRRDIVKKFYDHAGSAKTDKNTTVRKKVKNFTILVLGGSQGARQINEMVLAIVRKNHSEKSGGSAGNIRIQWLLQCGSLHLEKLKKEFPESEYPQLHLFAYHNAVQELYSRADILISRAGAGIITEAALFGLPSVFVPYPFAADNHQLANARYFESRGAAIVIDRKDSDPHDLEMAIEKLVSDPGLRESMSRAMKSLAVTDGAEKAAEILAGDL